MVRYMKVPDRSFLPVFSLLLIVLFTVSCGGGNEPEPVERRDVLHIAAASNLSYVMPQLIEEFKARNGEYMHSDIKVTKASSGSLTAQIRNNAPFAVFLAANKAYPLALYRDSLTVGPPVVYAEGLPVMVYKKELACRTGVDCLAGSSVKRVAIAQPDLAPYGKAALDILERAGVLEEVRGKFVFGASVTQAFQHATTAADAGFIAASLLYGDSGKQLDEAGMVRMDFAPGDYTASVLQQGMVLLDPSSVIAASFFRFMQSESAGEVLRQYGYRVE